MTDTPATDPPVESLVRTGCRLHAYAQFAAYEQPVPWLWHGYVARQTITLLTGQWKVGKTTLLAALLARLGPGGDLAGRTVTPGRAVVITEEGAVLWARRLARHTVGDWATFAFRPFGRKPLDRQWQSLLDDLADLHVARPIDLVVIDPLVAVLPGRQESSAEAMTDVLRPLRDLAARGPGVLLLHHPRKGSAVAGQGARGTGALPAFVDVLMEMHWPGPPAAENRRRRLTAWSRHDETPRRVLVELSADGREYAVVADDDAGAANEFDDLAEAAVRSAPGLTVRDVVERWPAGLGSGSERVIFRRLDRLTATGRLRRTGGGHRGSPYRYWPAGAAGDAEAAGDEHDEQPSPAADGFARDGGDGTVLKFWTRGG